MSRTGFVLTYAICPIYWISCHQIEIALSTAKAEYITMSSALWKLIPLTTLMKELHTVFPVYINKPNFFCKVHEDNWSTTRIKLSDEFTLQTKHIALKYHHFYSHVNIEHIEISFCLIEDQKADLLTKPLADSAFFRLRQMLIGWLVICLWYRPSVTRECGIPLLLDSHLANIQWFLLKVHQTWFPRNSICSGNSCKNPFGPDSDSTSNLPEIPPCVWCTTEWNHTNTKQKSCWLVWMTRSHAMSSFCPFLLVACETISQRARWVWACLVSRE